MSNMEVESLKKRKLENQINNTLTMQPQQPRRQVPPPEVLSIKSAQSKDFVTQYKQLISNEKLDDASNKVSGGKGLTSLGLILVDYLEFLDSNQKGIKTLLGKFDSKLYNGEGKEKDQQQQSNKSESLDSKLEKVNSARINLISYLRTPYNYFEKQSPEPSLLTDWIKLHDDYEAAVKSALRGTVHDIEMENDRSQLNSLLKIIEIFHEQIITIHPEPATTILLYKKQIKTRISAKLADRVKTPQAGLSDLPLMELIESEYIANLNKLKWNIDAITKESSENRLGSCDIRRKTSISELATTFHQTNVEVSKTFVNLYETKWHSYFDLEDDVINVFVKMGEIRDPTPLIELKQEYLKIKEEVIKLGQSCNSLMGRYAKLCSSSIIHSFSTKAVGEDFNWTEPKILDILTNPDLFMSLIGTPERLRISKAISMIDKKISSITAATKEKENNNEMMELDSKKNSTSGFSALFHANDRELSKFLGENNYMKKTIINGIATSLLNSLKDDIAIYKNEPFEKTEETFSKFAEDVVSFLQPNEMIRGVFIANLFSIHPLIAAQPSSFARLSSYIPIFNLNNNIPHEIRDFWKSYNTSLQKDDVLNINSWFVRETDCKEVFQKTPNSTDLIVGIDYSYFHLFIIIMVSSSTYANMHMLQFMQDSTSRSNDGSQRIRIFFKLPGFGWNRKNDPQRRLLDLSYYSVKGHMKNTKESMMVISHIIDSRSAPEQLWTPSLKPMIHVRLDENISQSSQSFKPMSGALGKIIQGGFNKFSFSYEARYNNFLREIMKGLALYDFDNPAKSINAYGIFPNMEILIHKLIEIYKQLGKSANDDVPMEMLEILNSTLKTISGVMYLCHEGDYDGFSKIITPSNTQTTTSNSENQRMQHHHANMTFVDPQSFQNYRCVLSEIYSDVSKLRSRISEFFKVNRDNQPRLFCFNVNSDSGPAFKIMIFIKETLTSLETASKEVVSQ